MRIFMLEIFSGLGFTTPAKRASDDPSEIHRWASDDYYPGCNWAVAPDKSEFSVIIEQRADKCPPGGHPVLQLVHYKLAALDSA
jgi:hypothetical protein